MVWRLDARGGLQIRAAHTAVARPSDPDPLGFPTAAAPFIDTAVIPAALDIRAQCREYGFEVTDADNVIIARSYTQITANPAMVRSVIGPPVLPLPATTSALNITVTAPGVDDRTYQADLRGLSSLAEIAQRLNAITPDLRAWAIPGTPELLHLETAGAGTSWGLRLDSLPLLLALGFDRTDMDLAEGTLTVSGRGTVANSQAVTHAEIGAALNRAVLAITGSTAVRALQVANEDPDIALRSLEGPVTIETEPASLRTALNVVETPTRTTLTPGSTLNADNSSIIVKIAGATAAVAHIWGDYAIVRGNVSVTTLGPAAVTTMLDLLRNSQISLAVDGAAARMLPTVPAALATIEEAIEFLAGQAPEAWIGIDLNGSVLFHSRDAGDGRSLSLDFSGFATGGTYPAGTVLGFEAAQLDENFAIGASGRGTVSRLGSVSWREVLNLLRAAADEGASPQTIYTAEVDSAPTPAIVRLTTNVFNWSLQQRVLGTGPNSVVFAPPGTPPPAPDDEETPPGNVLETSFPPAQAIDPGVFELTAVVTYPPQTVRALVAAQPARLPPIQMPTTLAVLNGSGFDLDVQGLGFRVVFSANTATTTATLAAQIERQTFWFVRARITGGGLLLETTGKGSALSLTVSDPTGGAAPAITGNPATGMTASGPLPISASGAGPVTDMNTVTPNEFRAILERAYISQAGDEARYSTRELDFRAYEAVGTAPSFATIRSNRGGCISHLDTVIDLAPSLGLSRSFERAPALRAAVVLPAFDGQKTLSGTLHIQFNDNTGSADLDPPAVVSVTFPSDDYAPADVARLIHNEIFARGFGQAGAYPDGTVVIETHVPGLAGTVRIPAPGTATSDPDQSLFRDLFGDTTERFERGWPGIGFGSVRHGLRSLPGNARGAAVWVFSAGPVSTAPIGVSTGASLAALRTQIDDALAAAPGGRIGLCALGTDGTLYVESGPVPLTLAIDGQPWAVRLRERPGETPELKEEPAVGFRLTHVPRTIRYARDRFGNLVESEFEDAQWVRLPAARDTGMPVGSLWFPSGFYWTAIRADASKTTDYDDTGRMIISGGVHPDDASRFFVHRARYWMGLDHWDGRENGGTLHIGQMLRIVRRSTGEFMLEVLWAVTP
jgi:hypothetical protein